VTEVVPVLTFSVRLESAQLKGKAALGRDVENSFAYQAETSGSLGEPVLSLNAVFFNFF